MIVLKKTIINKCGYKKAQKKEKIYYIIVTDKLGRKICFDKDTLD